MVGGWAVEYGGPELMAEEGPQCAGGSTSAGSVQSWWFSSWKRPRFRLLQLAQSAAHDLIHRDRVEWAQSVHHVAPARPWTRGRPSLAVQIQQAVVAVDRHYSVLSKHGNLSSWNIPSRETITSSVSKILKKFIRLVTKGISDFFLNTLSEPVHEIYPDPMVSNGRKKAIQRS